MNETSVHPRIAARAAETCAHRIETYQAKAVAMIEEEISVVKGLPQTPGDPLAEMVLRECQDALQQLKGLDPHHPPSADSLLSIANRLQKLCYYLEMSRAGCIAGDESK